MGSCHCGAVAIEVEAPEDLEVYECNCSMCERSGFLHLIVPARRFRLVRGTEALTTYTFNTRVAQHLFCRICGIKPFYVPRSNPNGFSVNLRCLDRSKVRSVKVLPFDGQNWEAAAGTLEQLSR
ncbi:MAG TPA: GFA family protein [Burkholderiales bacterium]|nr:GFA family protein [Burkholderiales bacterium]